MRRWDIVLTPFPFSDLSGQRVRPAVVLFVSEKRGDMIIAFLTSNLLRKSLYDVSVSKSVENGLRINSVLCLSKLSTLDTKCAIGKLGVLEPRYRKEVHARLHELLGFDE